jgi:uncharacterized protein (TIGR02246 family)
MVRSFIVAGAVLVVMAGPVRAEAVDPATSPFAALGKQYTEAYNRKDAAAVAALFSEDAIRVSASGMIQGRAAINKAVEDAIQGGGHDLSLRYHVAHVDGNTGWAIVEYQSQVRGKDGADTPVHGHSTTVYVRDGGNWKIKAQGTVNMPPPK